MDNSEQLDEIRKRLELGAATDEDTRHLLLLVEQLRKKNDVLALHVQELTQEIENVRSDFGQNR